MAVIHGEGIKVELLTDQGWQDIADVSSIEAEQLELSDEMTDWLSEPVTFNIIIEDWKEYVETASGKHIVVKPRTEM